MGKSSVSATTLHTQFICGNGGGVYDRSKTINNYLHIVLWNNCISYHKYCLNCNFSYYYVQIKKAPHMLCQALWCFTTNKW